MIPHPCGPCTARVSIGIEGLSHKLPVLLFNMRRLIYVHTCHPAVIAMERLRC